MANFTGLKYYTPKIDSTTATNSINGTFQIVPSVQAPFTTAPARYYTDYGSYTIYKLPNLDTPFYFMVNAYATQALEHAWAHSLDDDNKDSSFIVFENVTGVILGIFKNGGTIKLGYGANWLMENHKEYYVSS